MAGSIDYLTAGWRIGNYVLEDQIGCGGFSSVWRASHSIVNKDVAVKVVKKSSIESQLEKTRFQREISILKQMEHPFIAEFFEVIETQDAFYLVMEYVENGNLLDFVNANGRLSEDQARRYFAQLFSVLEYLHTVKKIAHRDLKCENVLLDRHNNIRVIDFGLSNVFTYHTPQLITSCGSPAYISPEMVKGQKYTKITDVWSAGIMLYAVMAGGLPFDDTNVNKILQKIVYSEVQYPTYFSKCLVDLMQKMICKDPEKRITLDKIKEHPWFSQTQYSSLITQLIPYNDNNSEGNEIQIDREIIEKMQSMNIDCHPLHQSLILGEYSELTAIYRLLYREKQTDRIADTLNPTPSNCLPLRTPGRLLTLPLSRCSNSKQAHEAPNPPQVHAKAPIQQNTQPQGAKRLRVTTNNQTNQQKPLKITTNQLGSCRPNAVVSGRRKSKDMTAGHFFS